MSKKKLNIVLIIVVLILWGIVIYRSLSHYFPSSNNESVDFSNNKTIGFKATKKDTFELAALNRDPFLNKTTTSITAPTAKVVVDKPSYTPVIKKTQPIQAVKPEIVWPKIAYFGYIKSSQKTSELILIKIDSKLLKTRKNETLENVLIKNIYKDSIEVSFNKQKKFVYLSR